MPKIECSGCVAEICCKCPVGSDYEGCDCPGCPCEGCEQDPVTGKMSHYYDDIWL